MKDGRNTVLFVDDEKNILSALRRGLLREEYNKYYAQSGAEALDIMAQTAIDVIVTDMRMPEMTGLELLKEVNKKYPETVKVILSGYTQLPQILATINQVNIYKFITKPWDMENEFKGVVLDAIGYFNTLRQNKILKESIEKKNKLYSKLLKENDEKIHYLKKDFGNINRLFHEYMNLYFEMLERQEAGFVKDDIESFKKGIELIDEYMLMLPTTYKKFSLGDLAKELSNKFALYEDLSVENYAYLFRIETDEKTYYNGDYNTIKLILLLMLKHYADEYMIGQSRIAISSLGQKMDDENEKVFEKLQIAVIMPKRSKIKKSNWFDMIKLMLHELTRIIDGSLQFTNTNELDAIVVRMSIEIV